MKIKTLSEFVEALAKVGECEKGKTRFFRGHSNIDYKLQPSIYRSNHLIANEHNIIKDVLTECHEYFFPHDTLFDKLVKMQHYGYPTRLLDITYNALVALYFSVSKIDGTDGEVIVFDIPNDEIKYHDSDTVAILSAISLQDKDFQSDQASIVSEYKMFKEKVFMLKEEAEILEYLQDNNELLLRFKKLSEEIQELPQNDKLNINHYIIVKEYNSQENIVKLLNDVRKDKSYFLPIIDYRDFKRILCVKPKANNPRILRQQGAFLIFGINDKKINQADLNLEWIVSQQEKKLIIDAKSKVSILNELKSFGINHQTLFPELDKQAEHIIARYKES